MSVQAMKKYISRGASTLDINQRDRLTLITETENGQTDNFASDVEAGLASDRKYLFPKYFYDTRGSELFVRITQTEEYYPTRVEKYILNKYAEELVAGCSDINVLIELGSGSAEKTEVLIKAFHEERDHFTYVPIDVSDIVIDSSNELLQKYENLKITGIISNYQQGLKLVNEIEENKLIAFLGSSIGNFDEEEANCFLANLRKACNPNDQALIGFDLVKDQSVLHAAYNDRQGVTKMFNLNILQRINRELHGDFDLTAFRHLAFYNESKSRIEMHLVSQKSHKVNIGALDKYFHFRKDETIHTENSHKFTFESIRSLMEKSGFSLLKTWTDPDKYFALCLFRPV